MKEMHGAKCGDRLGSNHAVPRHGDMYLPAPPPGHQPQSSLHPVLFGFYAGFVT